MDTLAGVHISELWRVIFNNVNGDAYVGYLLTDRLAGWFVIIAASIFVRSGYMDMLRWCVLFPAVTVMTRLSAGFPAGFLTVIGYLLMVGFLGGRDRGVLIVSPSVVD
jgi:hypothetical protein